MFFTFVGCGGGALTCKPGTLLVTLGLAPTVVTATTLVVAVTVGATVKRATISKPTLPASGTIEIDFAGAYPSNQLAAVAVVAMRGDAKLGSGSRELRLSGSCTALAIDIEGAMTTADIGMGGADAAQAGDLAIVRTVDGGVVGGTIVDAATIDGGTTAGTQPTLDMATCGAANASATHFVDPQLGSDDAAHGGAPSGCAYKTITFALTQASGVIALAPGKVYDSTTETFPLVLSGRQSIDGDPQATGLKATISGLPAAAEVTIVKIVMGTNNVIRKTRIESGSSIADCVDTNSLGGVLIDSSELFNCLAGVKIKIGSEGVTVSNSAIHDVVVGIDVQSGSQNAVTRNTIAAGSNDIQCVNGAATNGCGNTFMGTGVTCSACGSCPALTAACP
jgi:hypothetical protein